MNGDEEMYVTKRNGSKEIVAFDKILQRIKRIGQGSEGSGKGPNVDGTSTQSLEPIKINYTTLVMKVIDQLYDGISTTKIDELSADQCASMASIHPDYNTLAGRIIISNHHKNTSASFIEIVKKLHGYLDKHGKNSPLVSHELYQVSIDNAEVLEKMCDYSRDYLIDYFGFKTLERAYLMKIDKVTVERPQHMWLRVAIGIHGSNIALVRETYENMSLKYFTHATPTLFNAGTPHPQLSSCFLLSMEKDSIEGIYNTLKDCALISKWAGGIGLHIHNVRASGSHIRGTNGSSNGIVPMLRVFNNTAKYVDQCVHPNTMIYTTLGPIPISQCNAGYTQIFNINTDTRGTRTVETIERVLEHIYMGPVYQIAIDGLDPLVITPEHPIMILPERATESRYTIAEDLDRGLARFEWSEAKHVSQNDLLVYPIPEYVRDSDILTEEICYFYGVILGQLIDNQESYTTLLHKTGGFAISFDNRQKHNWYESFFNYFWSIQRDSNVEPFDKMMEFCQFLTQRCVEFKVIDDTDTPGKTLVSWESMVDLPYNTMDFKNAKYNGYSYGIGERWLFLPVDKIERILAGLGKNAAHESLKHTAFLLNLRCGRIVDKPTWQSPMASFRYKNYVLAPISSITQSSYNGVLYDLQMTVNHNYLLENGLVHNGGGKRNGSFAIYLEPWHADIELFLQMRKNHGDEELKARDLFYALWIPDLFMERVKADGDWTLMCPNECPGLADVWGADFVKLYTSYEEAGRGRNKVKARALWFQILDAQMETGTPYLLYKDAANRKSNQQNVGTIKSSNLCVTPDTKILTDKGQIAIGTLVGESVNVWNGHEFSEVTVFKTGENQPVIEVRTDDGCLLECTPYHKFFIHRKSNRPAELVEARHLKVGDKIVKCKYPILLEPSAVVPSAVVPSGAVPSAAVPSSTTAESSSTLITDLDSAYHTGYFRGLLSATNYTSCSDIDREPLPYKMAWLSGLCDSAGEVYDEYTIKIGWDNFDFLRQLKLIFQTCGINPKIGSCYSPRHQKPALYLILDKNHLSKLFGLGFLPKKLNIDSDISIVNSERHIKVASIIDRGKLSDTFCFREPFRNAGIFNGILTSQCSEIIQYSDENESAVCNLASIGLPTFIKTAMGSKQFDFSKLHEITRIITRNLNRIIDVNYYPTEKTRTSNMRHRPIGIGIQGLADVFMILNLTFTSDAAKQLNRDIFETIYHAALTESCAIAQKEGPYSTFAGSPASKGQLQFDLWGQTAPSGRYDWSGLKAEIQEHGLRNSLLLAPMPTASTSQILGFNECIEPITSNIYSRRTLAGEFIMANKYLMTDLINLGLWNEKIKTNIIANNGSIQQIDVIPADLKEKYKTVWEIPMRQIIDMAADRGAFICQSQSLNLWLEDPSYGTLTSMHFYAWSKGLKTGIYYLRRRGKHQAQQFTVEPEKNNLVGEEEICDMCSS
jgi:ribonucleoside-diphosphate reductase alpha chain